MGRIYRAVGVTSFAHVSIIIPIMHSILNWIPNSIPNSVLSQSLAAPECATLLQNNNIQYLDLSLRIRYNISDACAVTCSAGFYGDFCRDLSQYSNLPVGPWNQAGYCTLGAGILRSMTISIPQFVYVQYTGKDSVLVGISNPGRPGNMGLMSSVVSEVLLYSRAVRPVLRPSLTGSLDALLVRHGRVYVARTGGVDKPGVYDIVQVEAPMQARVFMSISSKATLFDVCVDKGAVVVYVYSLNQIHACYPDGTCLLLTPSTPSVSGMILGADCLNTLYISSADNIYRVAGGSYNLFKKADTTIYCMTGVSYINVLIFKSRSHMWQVNLGSGEMHNIPLGVTQTQPVQCSVDVSEESNQILVVQNGVISTLEAVQQRCPTGSTSTKLLCNSTLLCTACPTPPINAYSIEGSVSCEYACATGFRRIGSRCVSPTTLPCPDYYRKSPVVSSLCVPATMPWADRGRYAASAVRSDIGVFPDSHSSVYLVAGDGDALIHAVPGRFYLSIDAGLAWITLGFAPFNAARCSYTAQNSYYYINARQGTVWTAFTQQTVGGVRHCLWAVNAAGAIASKGSDTLRVAKAWVLDRRVCSVVGEGVGVYALFCKDNYIHYSSMEVGSTLSPLIGSPVPGHVDGLFSESKFDSPTALAAYDARLYITDTGNCVLREADLVRSRVITVAGISGSCQMSDGTLGAATLMHPGLISYTGHESFLLFIDRVPGGSTEFIRQFHAISSAVETVVDSPFDFSSITSILAFRHGLLVSSNRLFYVHKAAQLLCPPGTSSLVGNAVAGSECWPCPYLHYSDSHSGICQPCSEPSCSLPGQLLVPCRSDSDAYCGACSNKPTENSKYTSASGIPGTSSGGGDCDWVYVAPCPTGFYSRVKGGSSSGSGSDNLPADAYDAQTDRLCVACPPWSTTSGAGSGDLADCVCLGDGVWVDGVCVVPSPFASSPAPCLPLLQCSAYSNPAMQFPVLRDCDSFDVDTPRGVCSCNAGEFIEQIHPKVCTPCPRGLFSPDGIFCRPCPYLTEPSLDKTSCQCSAGTVDVAPTSSDPLCVCDRGRFFSSSSGCLPCRQNTYSVWVQRLDGAGGPMQESQCMDCQLGTWSLPGATACTPCLIGQYRRGDDLVCQGCPERSYSLDATVEACVDCRESCHGMKESPCPGNDNLFMCTDCSPPRENSVLNGGRDCATSCNGGFYEADGVCVGCTRYSKETCPPGSRFVGCSSYEDAHCLVCVNETMPLNFAVWAYDADVADGPSLACGWECEAGYTRALSRGTLGVYECLKPGEIGIFDIFTL